LCDRRLEYAKQAMLRFGGKILNSLYIFIVVDIFIFSILHSYNQKIFSRCKIVSKVKRYFKALSL